MASLVREHPDWLGDYVDEAEILATTYHYLEPANSEEVGEGKHKLPVTSLS